MSGDKATAPVSPHSCGTSRDKTELMWRRSQQTLADAEARKELHIAVAGGVFDYNLPWSALSCLLAACANWVEGGRAKRLFGKYLVLW